MRVDLGYRPRPWQQECHKNRQRFTVLALHRRAGKTELAIMELLDKALKFQQEVGLFVYLAPFLKQAKAIAWLRLKNKARRLGSAAEVNESELWVRLKHNGYVIRIFGADNYEGLRGLRLDGAVIDEVAQIKREVWDEVIQPALSDRHGWALFIGTPNGINLFSELYFKARCTDGWHAARYTVDDTNALDPAEVERLRADMNETAFAREYLCDFSAAGDNQLIALSLVEEASRRTLKPDAYDFAPVVLGVDPARFGDDRSVIMGRQGLAAMAPVILRGVDNMELADRVVQEISGLRPDAVFCDAGAGAGVIDRLRMLGHEVIEVPFGGKSSDPQYLNKRSEMWFVMAGWLKDGGAIPDLPELKQDLAGPVFHYDTAGRKCLETKDDMKKRGISSPDIGDALALTFAYPVGKRGFGQGASHHRADDYDLYR